MGSDKRKRFQEMLTAGMLALSVAMGAALSFLSGFSFETLGIPQVMLLVLWSGVCAACFVYGKGWYLALAAALPVGFFLRNGQLATQTASLIYHVSQFYDHAYGWGVAFSDGGPFPLPVLAWSCLTAAMVCRTVVRRKSLFFPLVLAGVPFCACLVVTDTPPAPIPLGLLLFGLVMLLLTQRVRRENGWDGAELTAMLAVPVGLAVAALLLALPREQYDPAQAEKLTNFWFDAAQKVQQLPGAFSSREEEVDLRKTGPNFFRKTPGGTIESIFPGTFYIPTHHYSTYTGTGWTDDDDGSGLTVPQTILGAQTDTVIQTVAAQPWLEHSAKVIVPPREYWVDSVEQGAGRTLDTNRLGSAPSAYYQLSDETRAWATEYLARFFPNLPDDRQAAASMVASLVRSSASYDLKTGRMPRGERDFARWFLEESDTGYCVHYATAAVVLLRAAGIPARYVEGYMVETKAGEEVGFTGEDAHAWAEYYLYGSGWMILEATASDRTATPTATEPERVTVPTEAPPETEEVTRPTQNPDKPTSPGVLVPGENGEKAPISLDGLWTVLRYVLWTALAAALLWGQRYLRMYLSRPRGSTNRQAVQLWREITRCARWSGMQPGEQEEEIALRAKFSNHTLAPEELAPLQEFLQNQVGLLRDRRWYWQIWYRLILVLY